MRIAECENRLYICNRCGTRKPITEFNGKYCVTCENDMKSLWTKHANEVARKSKKYLEGIREAK